MTYRAADVCSTSEVGPPASLSLCFAESLCRHQQFYLFLQLPLWLHKGARVFKSSPGIQEDPGLDEALKMEGILATGCQVCLSVAEVLAMQLGDTHPPVISSIWSPKM
eukprot:s667_g10.t1